jgi:hypothetical protein
VGRDRRHRRIGRAVGRLAGQDLTVDALDRDRQLGHAQERLDDRPQIELLEVLPGLHRLLTPPGAAAGASARTVPGHRGHGAGPIGVAAEHAVEAGPVEHALDPRLDRRQLHLVL